ncbi:Centrobin [Camelus dromedarius]|uniref:Centrobin n=1 Tax=Camelus dromedarius TaxID=9838 RepID=A0A5N4D242_CAMDR|nr:Centrobin [Camelus dromedarius]
MATSATSPNSPLRAKDLLSDSSEAPGLNQVSSEVTSQLYASLHLSRQAETTARAQLYLPSTSPPPHEVLDGLAQELSCSLSAGLENNLKKKHCERHIQSLQTRVLELQQQLAVAVTADRKKDIMIEQLDKTLARVVEGWNRHEAERTEVLRGLQEERQAAELTRSKQQEEEERQALTLSLELEQQQCRALQDERDEARAGQLSERRLLETLQVALEEERQTRAQQERQLKERYQALQEESQAQLEREKGNTQRESQAAREAQQQLALVQSEVRRLEGDLDTARRERDALQLEMSLVQARYESQRIQMESELAVQLEQRVTERLAQAQESSLRQAASLREHHRKQLQELNGQHQQELSTQLAQFKVEMAEREERQQQVAQDYELRLAREQARVRELQSGNQQLEEQRVELVERLQAMLQAHWEEANQLLSTPLLPPNPALLETAPPSNENPSADLLPTKSGPLTVPTWEEAPQVPRLPPPVHKTKVPLAMASSLFRVHELPSAHSQSGGPRGGSPERGGDGLASSRQLMEVSQLLRLYQARGWGALPAEDLLLYLKRLEHSGYQPGGTGG